MPRWARKRCSSRSVTPSAIRQVASSDASPDCSGPTDRSRRVSVGGLCSCRDRTAAKFVEDRLGRSRRGPACRDIAARLSGNMVHRGRLNLHPRDVAAVDAPCCFRLAEMGEGGAAQTDVMCPRCNVPAVLSSAGPGGLNGLSPASVATRPFPFLYRPLVDRLLSRSTPKGVRLARKFSKIRFGFFMRASCTSSGKRDEARPPFFGK